MPAPLRSRDRGRLEAHAPELVHHPERDQWYITTAGWPWVASLTSGEVAVAPLRWKPVPSEPDEISAPEDMLGGTTSRPR